MFVQVIQGHVSDADELRDAFEQWGNEVAPGSIGWLGTTAGVTADNMFVALARFESAETARRNSDRPEQHQWWMDTAKLFAGDVSFHDCRETATFLRGGSDDAGFVQVIQARADEPRRVLEMLDRDSAQLQNSRPEIIGGVVALHGDGGYTQAVYFTSEAAAREGEGKSDFQERYAREIAPLMQDAAYFDLKQPWLYSRR